MTRSIGKTFLFPFVFIAAAQVASLAVASQENCQKLIFAEYCIPEGTLYDLVPFEKLEKQFTERANTLKAERNTPSELSQERRQELEDMWQVALATAFDYADNHSHKLGSLDASQSGADAVSAFGALANGPLFRLTFKKNLKNAFVLSRPIQVYHRRVLNSVMSDGQSAAGNGLDLLLRLPPFGSGRLNPGELIDLEDFFAIPVIGTFTAKIVQAGEKSGLNFLGTLGFELVMAMQVAFEEKIRERNRALDHTIHFYKAGTNPGAPTRSPQVLFTGELMLPDDMVATFSDTELMLLMFHEAMHFARPNVFTLFSAADYVQRKRFPELNTEQAATYLANVLGRDVPGKPVNCPLDIADDDELLTDYYVFFMLRYRPELMHAYNAFLKRLHTEFDPGHVSKMAYRVRHGDLTVEYIESGAWKNKNQVLYDRQFMEALQSTITKYLFGVLPITQPRIEHFWNEMSKHSELKRDVESMRVFMDYYKNTAWVKDDASPNTHSNLTCWDISVMLRSDETRN